MCISNYMRMYICVRKHKIKSMYRYMIYIYKICVSEDNEAGQFKQRLKQAWWKKAFQCPLAWAIDCATLKIQQGAKGPFKGSIGVL